VCEGRNHDNEYILYVGTHCSATKASKFYVSLGVGGGDHRRMMTKETAVGPALPSSVGTFVLFMCVRNLMLHAAEGIPMKVHHGLG
jgi:hypothetical protein